jgi:hypothetical protein
MPKQLKPPASAAARARVAKLLAGGAPVVLDAVEAAGSIAQPPGFYLKRKKAAEVPGKPPRTGR